MAFSFTGPAYLITLFGMGLLARRFFQYWRKEKESVIAKYSFYFAFFFAVFMLLTAIGGLFFAKNALALKLVVINAAFWQSLGCACISYLIFYLKFPKISPWFGFGIIFLLGVCSTILTAIIPFNPTFESGAINWDIQPLPGNLRFIMFIIVLAPWSFIYFQQLKTSRDPDAWKKAFGLGLAFLLGLAVCIFDFLLEDVLKFPAISSDIAMGIVGTIILLLVLFVPKPPTPHYVKKLTSSEQETTPGGY